MTNETCNYLAKLSAEWLTASRSRKQEIEGIFDALLD